MTTLDEFNQHREELLEYIVDNMQQQGATLSQAINATTSIYFFNSNDVENMYKCMKADIPQQVKDSILAHDFNGLANEDKGFLPKSSQFQEA